MDLQLQVVCVFLLVPQYGQLSNNPGGSDTTERSNINYKE